MAAYLKFDLGPNQLLPTLDWRFMPKPDHYRTSGSATMNKYFLGLTMETATSPYLMVNGNEMPYPAGVDPDGVWHPICGILLYETDGFGTKTYTGYNLVWQYRCEQWTAQGSTGVVQIRQRLIKIKFDDPLDVTQICSYLIGFGGNLVQRREFYFVGIQDTHNDDNWVGAGIGYVGYRVTTGEKSGNRYVTIGVSDAGFSKYLQADDTIDTTDDPNAGDPDYPSKPGGGSGNHDRNSDPIPVPGLPTIGAQSLGAVTMYKLTSAEMGVFGQEMTASDLWQAVKLFFQNPQDYIIGCALVPFTPPGDSVWYPKIGAYTFNHAYPMISAQFVEIDCGSLSINEYWGSCFDYEPYTQITIWLPYIGYRSVPVDEVMNKTIYVKYHIDCLSGDCIAYVGVSAVGPQGPDIEKVLGQFSGNCAVQMPFGSVTFDQILSSGISMLSGAGVFAATGGNGGGDMMGSAAMSMLAGVKGEVQQGGTIGSSGGYMGVQKPYIIKRIRRQSLPENYINLKGYPSNIFGTLSQLTGYAEVEDIQLNNIPAMEIEREEIIELLKGGVLL